VPVQGFLVEDVDQTRTAAHGSRGRVEGVAQHAGEVRLVDRVEVADVDDNGCPWPQVVLGLADDQAASDERRP
jgi:hypothetical protein